MTEKKRMVAQIIFIVYALELTAVKFHGAGTAMNSIIFLFPIGILLPKIWEKCRRKERVVAIAIVFSLILEAVQAAGGGTFHIFYGAAAGATGSLFGYIGYYIGENA